MDIQRNNRLVCFFKMIEQTLAYLGKFLSTKSELPTKQIAFVDREMIFNYLSNNNLPVDLPAISYNTTQIADPMQFRPMQVRGNTDISFTSAKEITLIPVKLSIGVALLSSSLVDYFGLITTYYSLVKDGAFNVEVINDEMQGKFTCVSDNYDALSTPPGGKEGKDFDRGRYYVLEGSFEVNSYVAFYDDKPLIRTVTNTVNWGNILVFDSVDIS